MGNPPYLIVPPYTLEYQDPGPDEAFRIATEEDLVVRERVPIRTERPSVREPGTHGNHAPIGHAQNDVYSANSQEIPV